MNTAHSINVPFEFKTQGDIMVMRAVFPTGIQQSLPMKILPQFTNTRNVWKSPAYSLLGAVVSPPSK